MHTYNIIYTTVRSIPHGKVSSYGRIARLAGLGGQARLVGYALRALPPHRNDVPWWRVVNAVGSISNAYQPHLQRTLLEAEGVCFNQDDQVDLARFLWNGEPAPGDENV